MAFDGFPAGLRSIPVPAPVFGPLLEQIDDIDEFKCTLRVIWLLHHKRGHPRFITVDELLAANGTRTLGLILNNQRPADLAEHPRLPYAI